MATKTWTGALSTDWNDPGNWSPSGAPGRSDDVVIGTTANLPTLGTIPSTTVNTITISGTDTLTLAGPTLTVTNGITLNSTGGVIGNGRLVAAVTATGAAQIRASNDRLEVTGTITDNGNALVLNTAGSLLELDAASFAHSVLFGSGALAVNAPLTVATAMAIGSGSVVLRTSGSILTDASGITIGGGGIGGQGTVNANLSGTGSVESAGGTLHLTGTVASGLTLSISGFSVLSIENVATAAAPISIGNSTQALAIGSSGNLTINGGVESVANGKIIISAGGQLSDSAGFTLSSFATLIGAGKVTGQIGTGDGTGIVETGDGTLELVTALPASTNTAFEIANSGGSVLLLDGAPGTGNIFTFLGGSGSLALADDTGFDDTISGLNVGAGGTKTNFVDIKGHTVTISSVTGQGTTSGTITLSDGAVLHLTNLSSTNWYARTESDGAGGTDIFVSGPFQLAQSGLSTFSYSKGWTSQDQYPRALGDVNGDGKADIIGFGYNGAWVSLATGGGGFAPPVKELGSFSYTAGWTSQDQYPREVADVNGDGMADIVGFGYGGVYVSLATGGGNFAAPIKELGSFSYIAGWTSDDQYPRQLADVNGDGMADIVGFGYGGVYVSLATGGGSFAAPTNELGTFSYAAGWTSQDKYPRFLADVNGDGMADIVGFGYGAVYVSLATGGGHFAPAVKTLGTFSYANGWTSQDQYPRELADVNGDGMADIVGFGSQGVWVAHGKSDGTFGTPTFDFNDFGFSNAAGGWTSENTYPRLAGDVTGDGKADLVGFGYAGVSVAVSTDSAAAAASATPSTSDAITGELNDVYQQILGRDPDMSGLATYSAALNGGTSLAALRETIANSPKAQGDLRQIYQDVLARDADDGGLTTYTAELASGTSLAAIRGIIAHSPEAQSDLATLFQAVLGRVPGAAELVGMEDQLGGGTSQATLGSTLADTGSAGGYTSVTATAADATLTAESKTPTLFVFGDIAFGNDTIAGFDPTRDTIQLSHALVADLATLQSETTSLGDGSLVTLNAGRSILISGVAPTDLGTANLRIV